MRRAASFVEVIFVVILVLVFFSIVSTKVTDSTWWKTYQAGKEAAAFVGKTLEEQAEKYKEEISSLKNEVAIITKKFNDLNITHEKLRTDAITLKSVYEEEIHKGKTLREEIFSRELKDI